MLSKPVLTVAETTRILEAARAEAEKHQWAVAIVVVDDGGHQLGMLRLDGSAPASSYIATERLALRRSAAVKPRYTKT